MSGWEGISVDIYVAHYVIKHMRVIKLIWWVNDSSSWGQEFARICVTTKVTCNLTPGHVRLHLGQQAQMGLSVTLTVTEFCRWQIRICTTKLIWCVNISNWGQATSTLCVIIKVNYNLTRGHVRRLLGQLSQMGL